MERELFIARKEQARALQDVTFLGAFLEPASPSDVARRLGMSANLAHHHAQKHAALGLLEVKRERGKVYYQLAARSFKYPRTLLPPEDPENHAAVAPKRLGERFLEAYARSDRIAGRQDPDWIVCSFSPEGAPELPPPEGDEQPLEPRPAHFQLRTLTLRPENYRKLVRQIAALLAQAEGEEGEGVGPGTLAFLALDGALQEGMRDGHQYTSYV
jgi:DNA-binding transcriptional ArsR family regulator